MCVWGGSLFAEIRVHSQWGSLPVSPPLIPCLGMVGGGIKSKQQTCAHRDKYKELREERTSSVMTNELVSCQKNRFVK